MRLSIRVTTIIALNLFVVSLALTFGWIAQDVAGRLVEERYVRDMVRSASGFFQKQGYPRSNTMMGYLHELFDAEWVATEGGNTTVVASSLSPGQTEQFGRAIEGDALPESVHIDGQSYRVGTVQSTAGDTQAGLPTATTLYMLVADAQFQEARKRAKYRIAQILWPAVGVVTILAVILSLFITRPIRKLATRMDHLSQAGSGGAAEKELPLRGPKEVVELAQSFDQLLVRLADTQRQVVENDRLATLGKLSLTVAHELRNPLSGIKMNLRILQDDTALQDDPSIEVALREIGRMDLYLDELISLSERGEPNPTLPPLTEMMISQEAESVLHLLAGKIRHARIDVKTIRCDNEHAVWADSGRIRQAIMNLLVNAIEACAVKGTITLTIEPAGDQMKLRIADTGTGVPESMENVFAAFVTAKPNGVGLGLHITHQIITQYGGDIGHRNTDTGAEFWFTLPTTGPHDDNEQRKDESA